MMKMTFLPVPFVFARHLNVCALSDGHFMHLATFASC